MKTGIITGITAGIVAGLIILIGGNWYSNRQQTRAAADARASIKAMQVETTLARARTCKNNLRMIENAVQSWAVENNVKINARPVWENLSQYVVGGQPRCPEGGLYDYGTTDGKPSCSFSSHSYP